MRARGSKGPEYIAPLEGEAAVWAGMALAAASRGDWVRARDLLYRLTDNDLETLGSVVSRFAVKGVWRVRAERLSAFDPGVAVGVSPSVSQLLGDRDGPYWLPDA